MLGAGAGKEVCEHDRMQRECPECKNKDSINSKAALSICEHNRERKLCKICRAAALCEHGRERRRCVDCGGPGICEHRRIKRQVRRPCPSPLPPPAAAAPTAGSPLTPFFSGFSNIVSRLSAPWCHACGWW
jgi:hypothetical protein